MRIVHLTWGLGLGGSETLLADLANLQAQEHEVWVIIGNDDVDGSTLSSLGSRVRAIRLQRPPGSRSPWFLARMLLTLWRIRPDVIHAHQESFGRLKGVLPAPMLLTVHSTGQPLGRDLGRFDAVCCISEAVRSDVLARSTVRRERVVRNGVPFAALAVKNDYGGSPFRLVQVGRLDHEVKGQDLLIRALGLVNEQLGPGRVTVDFIGAGASAGYLQGLAREEALGEECRFLGARARGYLYEHLRDYDLLLQPSRQEGFGLAVVEGIAAGLPVLVSDVEGPLEIIDGGRLGSSFRSGDCASLAGKIVELVGQSAEPGWAAEIGERRETARERYDVRLTAQGYLELYRGLLG